MSQQNPAARPVDYAIMNMIEDPTLQPEALKTVFKKLTDLQPVMFQIEKALNEARQSMSQLTEQRAKTAGSFEALMDLIETGLSAELIEQYGKPKA